MKKKNILIIKIGLIVLGTIILFCLAFALIGLQLRDVIKKPGEGLVEISYSEDVKLLKKWMPNITGVEKIYWKEDLVGRLYVKPKYYMIGFLLLEDSEIQQLYTNYSDWEKANIEFPEGLDPKITGYNIFDWQYSYDCSYYFSREILKPQSYGEVYFDFTNNIIYFEYTFD